jgi:hypothetical protein
MAALASARSAAAAGAGGAAAASAQQQQQQQSVGFGTVVVGGTVAARGGGGQGSLGGLGLGSAAAAGLVPSAADAEDDNSYMAALKSAAADRERGHRGGVLGGLGGGLGGPPPPAAAAEGAGALSGPVSAGVPGGAGARSGSSAQNVAAMAAAAAAAAVPGNPLFIDRLWERLAAWYESGLLVQLPFLSAASAAAPLALLGPTHAPCSAPLTASGPGGVEGLDPEAYALLQDMAAGGLEALLQPPGAGQAVCADAGRQGGAASFSTSGTQQHYQAGHGSSSSGNGSRPLGMGARGGSLRRDTRGRDQGRSRQQQWREDGETQREQQCVKLPPYVLSKALHNPCIQNLARSLAYHRACLLELPLEQAAAVELVQLITDLGSALQTILGSAL